MATHLFSPEFYYSTIGQHEPVLEVSDGDSVVTSTVCAEGFDSSDQRVHLGGNGQTGPFFIRGAQPGDALEVRFDRITPNRRRGWSVSGLAERVVDPAFVRELPTQEMIDWDVDVDQGVAQLIDASPRLAELRIPTSPMLGCFGVAPAGGQMISTETSSFHGGNMDYRGHREGVTVLLPVATEGALFFLGDGHAAQGEGEISGAGIEISMDVQFTVTVHKSNSIIWPRTVDSDYVMAVGNARPLDEALQAATTELLRWLVADYGFTIRDASTLLGQVVEYDIANVFDPAYTVVAKINKKWIN